MTEGWALSGILLLGTANLLTRALFRCPWVLADSYTHFYVAEEMRRTGSLHPRLDKYLFDATVPEPLDYPPLFGRLLATVVRPGSWPTRELVAQWLPAILDTLALWAAALCARWLSGSTLAGFLAACLWLLAPCTHAQTLAVSGRPLGALLATVLFSALARSVVEPWPAAGMAVVVGAALYLANRLAVQAWFLLTVAFSWALWSPWPLSIQAGSLLLAAAITRGLGWRVHVGHWRHMLRLRRLMPKKGWHQLARFSWRRAASPQPRGAKLLLRVLALLDLPFVWLLPLGAATTPMALEWSRPLSVHVMWLVSLIAGGALIQALPALRFIGEGFRYYEFAIVPLAVLLGAIVERADTNALALLAAASLPLTALAVWHMRRTAKASYAHANCRDDRAVTLARRLRGQPVDRFLVMPLSYAPLLTVEGGKRTLMMLGEAASDLAEDFFPVMEKAPREYVLAFAIDGVFLDRRYVEPQELGIASLSLVDEEGPFGAYTLTQPAPEPAGVADR
jgi:hypothetical protein